MKNKDLISFNASVCVFLFQKARVDESNREPTDCESADDISEAKY
jgi:hypothetical protein